MKLPFSTSIKLEHQTKFHIDQCYYTMQMQKNGAKGNKIKTFHCHGNKKNYLGIQALEFTRHKQSQTKFVIKEDHGNANSHKSKEVVFLVCRCYVSPQITCSLHPSHHNNSNVKHISILQSIFHKKKFCLIYQCYANQCTINHR